MLNVGEATSTKLAAKVRPSDMVKPSVALEVRMLPFTSVQLAKAKPAAAVAVME